MASFSSNEVPVIRVVTPSFIYGDKIIVFSSFGFIVSLISESHDVMLSIAKILNTIGSNDIVVFNKRFI